MSKFTVTGSLSWCRDHLGRALAATSTWTFMWIAVIIAVCVGYYWDGEWAKGQAPEGMELSFRAGGWVIRTWTVFALVGAVALYRHKANILGSIVAVTWLCTSALAYGHILGFMATGQQQKYNTGAAVENKVEISDTGLQDKLTLIATQKDEIRADRDADVAALESALDDLINDGDADNDKEATDTYTALINDVRTKARDDLADLSKQERDLTLANTQTKLDANEQQVTAVKFDPLYGWLAGWFASDGYNNDATQEQTLKNTAQVWATIWAFFIELIGGAGPAILYAAHAHFSDRAEEKDPTRVEAGRKAAETRNRRRRQTLKIQEQADSYLPAWRKAVQYARNTKWTAKGISDTAFPNVAIDHVIEVLRKANKKGDWLPELEEEINLVKRLTEPEPVEASKKYAVDIIDPEPKINGSDQHTEGDRNVDANIS